MTLALGSAQVGWSLSSQLCALAHFWHDLARIILYSVSPPLYFTTFCIFKHKKAYLI